MKTVKSINCFIAFYDIPPKELKSNRWKLNFTAAELDCGFLNEERHSFFSPSPVSQGFSKFKPSQGFVVRSAQIALSGLCQLLFLGAGREMPPRGRAGSEGSI